MAEMEIAKAPKYELVLDKDTMIVEKTESWNPEEEEVEYAITLIAECACEPGGEKKRDHIRIVINTDDKLVADKFQVGFNIDVKCTKSLLHKTNLKHGVQ